VRVLIFHGYLLSGTGSNVYNARLAEALRRSGHEVHLVCQDRHPEDHAFIDAAGEWQEATLDVRKLAGREPAPGSCTIYRPDIGPLLPVYVADRYEGLEARTFTDCSDEEIERYVEANVAAVRELVLLAEPELALAGSVPYAVKVHGSALEYTVKPQPERFLPPAREGIAPAASVLVGSRHTAESLWTALGEPNLPARTRLGPPGVDVARFAPRDRSAAAAGLRGLVERQRALDARHGATSGGRSSSFDRDPREAAAALGRLDPDRDVLVAYVGKLIVSKGVDLLVAAWPLVVDAVPGARLAVVGFGSYRRGLEGLLAALAARDLDAARTVALAGRRLEDPAAPARPLRHLLAFLDALHGDARERYLAAAPAAAERVVFTGRLDHEELADVLPACSALVVPSTFPEAFGMVAAEAAACGALPVSAAHSGLAEVTRELAQAVPEAAPWLAFPVDDTAVQTLAVRVGGWLGAPGEVRARVRAGLVSAVSERWSWERVAAGVLAAARGELDALDVP
jgi:glycosyltransferase involved in cell wall biosynthesis